jgi:hypothetical protein
MTEILQPDLFAIRDAFVRPFYLRLPGLNITLLPATEVADFREALLRAARSISDDSIEGLLAEREWRGRLTAAWFVGLTNNSSFVRRIGELLIASEVVYAGTGYCLALGLIGGQEAADYLRSYLDTYLPLNGRVYNQDWAIGALAYLERSAPAKYLEHQLWRNGDYSMDPIKGIETVADLVSYLQSHGMIRAN